MNPSWKVFNSTVVTSPIWPWRSRVRNSSTRPQRPLQFIHDEGEWESLQFNHRASPIRPLWSQVRKSSTSRDDLPNWAMTKVSRRAFNSVVSTSLILPRWSRSSILAQVRKPWIRLRRRPRFRHNEAKSENLRFGHNGFSNSAMTESSPKVIGSTVAPLLLLSLIE